MVASSQSSVEQSKANRILDAPLTVADHQWLPFALQQTGDWQLATAKS
jgi:hypothetical protein